MAAAHAQLAYDKPHAAIAMLESLRRKKPAFRPEQVTLALAQAHSAAGLHDQASAEFANVVEQHDTIEARVEYALWALERNESALAAAQIREVNHSRKHMMQYTRSLHRELFRRPDDAVKSEQAG